MICKQEQTGPQPRAPQVLRRRQAASVVDGDEDRGVCMARRSAMSE